MPTVVTVRVDGLRQLGERMAKLKADVALKAARSATGSGATVIKKLAKDKLKSSPSVDSGLVEKNVIIKRLSKRDSQLTSEHIVTVKKVDYPLTGNETRKRNTRQVASFLEHGTVKMAAEPFLRPAFDQGKEKALQAIVDRLAKQITKAGG